MSKLITIQQALGNIREGMTLMIGGFLAVGTPEKLVDGLVERNTNNLTIIGNDTAFPDKGIGKLVVNRQLRKAIVSHIGTNPETGRQMNAGELIVELVPQGSLAEKIRAGGAGLGGVLTPTGVGTIVEEGKQKITIDGHDYLLERPLKADVALLKAHKADKAGNLVFRRSARNFNPSMAMAADLVIVEAEIIVEVGEIDPDLVMTPGIFVDWIVQA
jgi:acetate CoA/acetoacetate CoA-transferase alpha subunit